LAYQWQSVVRFFPDGAFFMDLAPLCSSALVVPTMAQAIGLTEPTRQGLIKRLADALAVRQLLLLLDNCEHVVSAATEIRYLLDQRPSRHTQASKTGGFIGVH
jgi:predicted ATPase